MRCNKCSKIIPPNEEHVQYGNRYSQGGYFCEQCWQKKQEWTAGDTFAWVFIIAFLAFLIWFCFYLVRDKD